MKLAVLCFKIVISWSKQPMREKRNRCWRNCHFLFLFFLDYLKSKLQSYVSAKLKKVRIIRTSKREGLIRARLIGARAAKGQVITFLDAHCEANVGWLEPLLSRIHSDRTIVAVPVIDIINSQTFAYSGTPSAVIGGFSWDMQFSWHSLPLRQDNRRRDKTDPIR